MENWEEQKFNAEWREAFQGAEATPSDQVWKNIDTRLMMAENTTMKKRVVFYQRMAAASVGILFLVSGYAFYINSGKENLMSANNQSNGTAEKLVSDKIKAVNDNQLVSNSQTKIDQGNSPVVEPKGVNTGNNSQFLFSSHDQNRVEESSSTFDVAVNSTNEALPLDTETAENLNVSKSSRTNDEQLFFQFSPRKLSPSLPKRVKPNDLGIAYRVADAKPAIHKKSLKKSSDENTWAVLGIAAGSFSQSASNLDLMQADAKSNGSAYGLQTSNVSKTEKSKPGSSFSMSLFGGKRLSKRWLLQGGFNYLNQTSQSATTAIEVASANSLKSESFANYFSPENANSVTYTTNSQLNNTFQFISLPVQAGYMLVDQKLGVQLNGGISPDVFLRSVMSDKASGEQTVSSTGSSSTFKTLSISGLGGLELSYRIAERYRVSLVPGFRYSLTSVYKENSLASSKPFTADIGLRFRYVFN